MPNWVHNRVEIHGKDRDLDELATKLANPGEGVCLTFNAVVPIPAHEEANWYQWNVANWGTKWDACEPYVAPRETGEALVYEFRTAWSPPVPVFEQLSCQHPDLQVTHRFEEEQGWGGQLRIERGHVDVLDQWDIPDSHAEHQQRGRICVCDGVELDSHAGYLYDDCVPDLVARLRGDLHLSADELAALNVLLREWEGTVGDAIAAARKLSA